jgi:hypothetical protein
MSVRVSEESLEKAAEMICDTQEQTGLKPYTQKMEVIKDEWRAIARAGVQAYLSAEREAGRAMMPREATDAMIAGKKNSFFHVTSSLSDTMCTSLWAAMFDASTEGGEPRPAGSDSDV